MSLPVPIRMTPSRAGWPTAVVVAALSLTATGCTRKVIAAAPAPVPLAVPSVPPRIVGPVVVPEERPQPVAEAPAAPTQRPASRPAGRQPAARSRCRDRRRGSATGARRRAPSRSPRPPTPAPLLRTRDTANDVEAAKKVQDVLRRAEQNLAKVNYRGLSANGRQACRHRPPVHHPGGRRPREAPARSSRSRWPTRPKPSRPRWSTAGPQPVGPFRPRFRGLRSG